VNPLLAVVVAASRLLCVAALLSSCWAAELEECITRCEVECPVGLECREGYCMLPGSGSVCSAPPACVVLEPLELPDAVCTGERFELAAHASGGQPPYVWAVAPRRIMVTGATQSADVTLVGEFPRVDPDRPPFTIRVTGSEGGQCGPAERDYELPLFERPSVAESVLPPACVGRRYERALKVTGQLGASYTWLAAELPPGLNLSPDGVLEGRLDAAGEFRLSVGLRDAHCEADPAPALSLTALPTAECVTIQQETLSRPCLGQAYSAQLSAGGGQPKDVEPRYTWVALTKPTWLDFEPDTQVLSALADNVTLAAAAQDGTLTVRVEDAAGQVDTRTYDLTPRADCPP
jgi:hypothetical protein